MTLLLSIFAANANRAARCSIRMIVNVVLTAALVCVSSAVMLAQNAYEFPLYPKYQVLGVVYAPPGSASSVTYGSSTLVGSAHSLMTNSTYDNVTTTSQTTGFSLFGFGDSTTTSTSNSWGTASSNTTSYSQQTTSGNAVTTLGPVSSALGVNHDNDIIYIWLNPVLLASITSTGANGGAPFALNWGGLQFNSCDLTDASDKVNFLQLMNGCDPNQYPFADIVGIPVWCLKNPYFPAQSCAQWLPFTSRSWDLTPWGKDSNGVPLGPGLSLADYADILKSDPFISQTSISDQYTAGYYCHPTYGVNLDPNDSEVIPDSTTFATTYLHSGSTWAKNFCGTAATVMSRFDPYGTVQYPVPGPNGEPQTYSGNFSYTTTTGSNTAATTTSNYSYNQNTTTSFAFSANFGALAPGSEVAGFFGANLSAGFNFSFSNGNGYSDSSAQTYTTSKENATTNSAAYSITGPQASDNYTGPVVFDVYQDNVYGTFAFYSDEQRQQPPIQLSLVAGQAPITVTAITNFGSVAVGSSSASQTIKLTNNSQYPMTMVGPAVSFTDPGFQIVPGLDFCSNVQLQPNGTTPFSCQITIEFSPVVSDAPNTIQASYPINAYLIAAGTENISSWQNILVSSTGVVISGTATPGATTQGATLLPQTQNASQANAYQFPVSNGATAETEVFTFTNYYSSSVTFPAHPLAMVLSDSTDFSVINDTGTGLCAGATVLPGKTCNITLQYLPVLAQPPSGYTTLISAWGTVAGSPEITQLAIAGGAGSVAVTGTLSLTPNPTDFSVTLYPNCGGGGCELTYGTYTYMTLTNNSSVSVGSFASNPCNTSPYGGNNSTCMMFTGVSGGAYWGPNLTANCPTTLAPGKSCTAVGIYSTAAAGYTGTFTGTITATGTASTGATLSAQVNTVAVVVDSGSAKMKIAGAEQSATKTTPAKPAKATVTLSGSIKTAFTGLHHLSLTVGTFKATLSYHDTATRETLAKALAAAVNVSASPVKATVNGDSVTLTNKIAGAAGNIAYAATDNKDFSIGPRTGSLTGGTDAVTTTIYDSGSVDAAVGSVTATAMWGKESTPQKIAGKLAAALNTAANGAFTASATGGAVTITSKIPSSISPLTVQVNDSMGFSPASYAATTGN